MNDMDDRQAPPSLPVGRVRARADALENDLPWRHTPGGVGFTGQGGRVSGIACEPEVARRIVTSVNAHQMLLSALLELKVAADHRAEHGRYPDGMGARGLTFEAWVSSVVDSTVDALGLQASVLEAAAAPRQGDDGPSGLDLPRAA